ncbi:MAG: GspH/FimT family pseudopilin [Moraxellaceae bacterium]|jgi:type IV fimbrial biogenesis protein FimT|nr:GspH/FimT family pseudopilin [Moraxellaceae bacterium]MBK8325979.1 GspH/FimT family pseudopilin [Moraxellaceae bacterium]MBK9186958.1 GspH/FimT family pseudopilin [Moraxellaceae bacterium]MBL0230706.1 GspH/FimT family pseudopilin [Moraxellaceae bacterium]
MRHARGYTLIETLTVITILCIILLFAQSNMSAWRKTQQAELTYKELKHIVLNARSRAINSRRSLTLCGSSDSKICDNNWTIGVLLFEDGNRNAIIDEADYIISYKPLALKNATLKWQGFSGSKIIFERMGITSASNGTFTYCELDKNPLYSRQVIVSRGGRARLSQDKNGDGFHDNSQGNTIVCP